MLGTASEEIKKSDSIRNSSNITALRDQQEKDFGLWGPYEFAMPESEGKWDSVTTNSAKVLANRIMGSLSGSELQLFIDVGEEHKQERKKIANTEMLANAVIWAADRERTRLPSGKRLQSALSAYAVLKGGTATSVYWYLDDNGKPVCDIKDYDPTFCQWIEGERDIIWFCHREYVSSEFIKRTYKKQIDQGFSYGKGDRILNYTFWDGDEWKVAINNEYVDEFKHGLGYVPVNIRSCGPVPYIQSEKYSDTMKYSWMSCFANNRDIYDLESKMLSIESSKATESGKIKIAGEWDSARSGGQPPEGLEKLGYGSKTRNEIVLFDAAKGQKFGGMVQPPSNEVVDQFLNRIRGMDIIGSWLNLLPQAMATAASGALVAEMRAISEEFTNSARECVQDDFIWDVEEAVRQFKNGDFGKYSAEGISRLKGKEPTRFLTDLEPKDIVEKHFDCNLVADRLRDEIQELGAAIQKVSYGLSSRRTAMLKHNIVEDPDREQDIMDEEIAAQDPVFRYDKLAKYFKDMGTPEGDRMANYYIALSAITIEKTVKQAIAAELMPPQQEAPPKPTIQTPQAEAGQIGAGLPVGGAGAPLVATPQGGM